MRQIGGDAGSFGGDGELTDCGDLENGGNKDGGEGRREKRKGKSGERNLD